MYTVLILLLLISILINMLFYVKYLSYDGVMHIDSGEGDKQIYVLELEHFPEQIADRKRIVFKVLENKETSQTIHGL